MSAHVTSQVVRLHTVPVVRHQTFHGVSGRTYAARIYRLCDVPEIAGGTYVALAADGGRPLAIGAVTHGNATQNRAEIRFAAARAGALEVGVLTPVRYASAQRNATSASKTGACATPKSLAADQASLAAYDLRLAYFETLSDTSTREHRTQAAG